MEGSVSFFFFMHYSLCVDSLSPLCSFNRKVPPVVSGLLWESWPSVKVVLHP